MRLTELIEGLDVVAACPIPGAVDVASIEDDSRRVAPGALFIARPGPKADGASFIEEAVRRGAAAVVCSPEAARLVPEAVPALTTPDPALATALLAHRFHGDPTSRMDVVGVTGTNGKTTISYLVRALLEASGRRTGLISTVSIDSGGPARANPEKAVLTTPGAVEMARRLAAMAADGAEAAVVETSSHALHQRRVAGIRYDVGVFTNLTGEHLDYHIDMASYAAAKAMLFESLPESGTAVMNADDPWTERMLHACRARIVLCSLGAGVVRLRNAQNASAQVLDSSSRGLMLDLRGPWGSARLRTPLVGAHNAMNALQAACAAHALGADAEMITAGLELASAPPGRLQRVARSGSAPEQVGVYVDYAHTDDALERALTALRGVTPTGAALWVVFGCGGDRDRAKRPRMGAVASRLADRVVVTSDNPRTENPEHIIDEVVAGASPGYVRDADRERAIRFAIARAHAGDVVLIAGKGHEDYQILPDGRGGTVRRYFDDVLIARDALAARAAGKADAAAGAA